MRKQTRPCGSGTITISRLSRTERTPIPTQVGPGCIRRWPREGVPSGQWREHCGSLRDRQRYAAGCRFSGESCAGLHRSRHYRKRRWCRADGCVLHGDNCDRKEHQHHLRGHADAWIQSGHRAGQHQGEDHGIPAIRRVHRNLCELRKGGRTL